MIRPRSPCSTVDMRPWIGIAFLVLAAVPSAVPAGILGYTPERHDRFASGYSTNPTPNTSPNFIAAGFDLSGIGWNTNQNGQSVALISPLHFLAANHYRPSGTLTFFNRDNQLKTYSVGSYFTTLTPFNNTQQTSDLVIGTLTAPIPTSDNIAFYPVLAGPLDFYLDQEILTYAQGARIGRNKVDDIGIATFGGGSSPTAAYIYDYDEVNGFNPDEYVGDPGDSGSPTFIAYNNQLTLLGAKMGIGMLGGTPVTVDSFLPFYIDQVNTIMSGSGYQLQVIAVPEPSVITLIAGTAVVGAWWGRRRRRSGRGAK